MDSKIKKDPDIDVNRTSDYPHKDVSAENTSEASTNQSNADGSQLNKMPEEKTASISKEKVVFKQENLEERFLGLMCQVSDDFLVTSTNESCSSKIQELRIPSEENIYVPKVKEPIEADRFAVCMSDTQNLDNTASLKNQWNSNEDPLSKASSEENLSADEGHKSNFNIKDSQSHRQNDQYFSGSSDFETESSDSSDCDEFFANMHKSMEIAKPPVIKSLIEDLPPVEYLSITANPNELRKIGTILHSVIVEDNKDYSVIVLSDENSNPLNEDSVLFLSSDEPLGKIDEVLGNVNRPQYRIRFNNSEDIFNKLLTNGQSVYYLPENRELTHYVLVDDLKKQKGSDASWKDNNEPPEDQIDYSDDEQEKLAKQKRRAKNRRREENCNDVEIEDVSPTKVEKRQAANNPERPFLARPSRNRYQSPANFNPPRSSFHSYSPRSFGPTPPLSDNSLYYSDRQSVSSPQPPPSKSLYYSDRQSVSSPQPPPSDKSLYYSDRQSVSSPQPFGTFPQSNVSRCWPPAVPPTSQVSASSNFASSDGRIGPQLNSPSLMAAPQNNVPLQQQLLLQPQQPITSFLSRPPPNFNFNSNPRAFLHQHQSFTPPTFGALPAARPAVQNTIHQSSINQDVYPVGTNFPCAGLSRNVNIVHSGNITPTNLYGHQGKSYHMMQSNAANSLMFPPRNTRHNIGSPVTQPVFVPIQSAVPSPCSTPPPPITQPIFGSIQPGMLSPCPTPPPPITQPIFGSIQPGMLSPCPTTSFVPCVTPPLPVTQPVFHRF